MKKMLAAALAALSLLGESASAASVTLSGLADSEDGMSYGVDARFSPTDSWAVGAGVGKNKSSVGGADFSGTSLRLSTDLSLGDFSAGASVQRWKDSNQLRSTTVLGELGWMAANGLSLRALLDDRNLTVQYTTTVLGQPRETHTDFKGTGIGADISWYGTHWNTGARFIDYDYGRSVDRVRAALNSTSTTRFPGVPTLLDTIVTRTAGAPDQQLMATVGRKFSRASLHGDWAMQRDALTHTKVKSVSVTHGYEFGAKLRLDTTVGFSDSGATDTVAFGGVALTLRNQAARD
ncbi:MAG: hypothetical protein ABIQ86_01760 [Steroidobacteraceae bacterium]